MKKMMVLVFLIFLLSGCNIDGETPKENRFGITKGWDGADVQIVTDSVTGCNYIVLYGSRDMNGITALYDENGKVSGCKRH